MIDESLGSSATDLFQYVVLRRDLQEVDRWPFGAIAAQGVLAATGAIVDGLVASDKNTLEYTGTTDQTLLALTSMRTVVFEMSSGDKLYNFATQLGEQASLGVHLWQEQAVGDNNDLKYTALATWAAPKYMLDPLFKGLSTANWHGPQSRQIALYPVNGDPNKYKKCIMGGRNQILNQRPKGKRIKLWGEDKSKEVGVDGDSASGLAKSAGGGIQLFGEGDVAKGVVDGLESEASPPPTMTFPPPSMGSAIDFLRSRRSDGAEAAAGGGLAASENPEATNMAELLNEVKGVTDKARAEQDEIDKRLEELMADIDREDEMREAKAREEIEMQRLREAHADSIRKKAIERKAAEEKATKEAEIRRVEKAFLEEQARKTAEKEDTSRGQALPESGHGRKGGSGPAMDANSFWSSQLENPWRRKLRQRRLATDAMQNDVWDEAWAERIECWWLSLSTPSRMQLSACMGALALHMSSRLDASWRAAQGLLGHSPSPMSGGDAAREAADPNCKWLEQSELGLPDFPAFPSAPDGGGFKWQLPPLPRLVPSLESLQALVEAQELHLTFEDNAATRDVGARQSNANLAAVPSAALGTIAGAGLAMGTISTIWLFASRRQQHRRHVGVVARCVAPVNARRPVEFGRTINYNNRSSR